jgi:hypothetical protein
MPDSAPITRSEAVHRLKLASAAINCAIVDCREGLWGQTNRELQEALEILNRLAPHVKEVAGAEAVVVASSPYTSPPAPAHSASHSHAPRERHTPSSTAPPKPIPIPKPAPAPPPPPISMPKPIPRPRPAPAAGAPRPPIITPPPARPAPPPPEPEYEDVVFNLTRIPGRPEYAFTGGPSLTNDELLVAVKFAHLSYEAQARVVEEFRRTGAPVRLSVPKDL